VSGRPRLLACSARFARPHRAGDNPAEERELDHKAITVKELCERYLEDAKNGLILGKKRRPKKASATYVDEGRIRRHIIPLLGTRRVKDLTSADVIRFMCDVASGKTKADQKTRKHGRAIVRGGIGTGTRWAACRPMDGTVDKAFSLSNVQLRTEAAAPSELLRLMRCLAPTAWRL
jgi:hypothetical protein